MGRQNKAGLDYFELDCHMEEKVRLLQAEFGLKGFAILVKLYQKIYGEFGYYCEWSEDGLLLFMSENGLGCDSKNLINEIVQACLRRNIFSAEIYHKYGVLTSVGVQKRYLAAVSRRESVELIKEYLLISVDKISSNVNINSISVCRNEENVCRNAQRREEKSRVEKSREENNLSNSNELDCPSEGQTDAYGWIRDLWNDNLKKYGIAPIRSIDSKRRTFVKARLAQYGDGCFGDAIKEIIESDFLRGKHSGRPWQVTFDWLILPNNFPKVIEGNYRNSDTAGTAVFSVEEWRRNDKI